MVVCGVHVDDRAACRLPGQLVSTPCYLMTGLTSQRVTFSRHKVKVYVKKIFLIEENNYKTVFQPEPKVAR